MKDRTGVKLAALQGTFCHSHVFNISVRLWLFFITLSSILKSGLVSFSNRFSPEYLNLTWSCWSRNVCASVFMILLFRIMFWLQIVIAGYSIFWLCSRSLPMTLWLFRNFFQLSRNWKKRKISPRRISVNQIILRIRDAESNTKWKPCNVVYEPKSWITREASSFSDCQACFISSAHFCRFSRIPLNSDSIVQLVCSFKIKSNTKLTVWKQMLKCVNTLVVFENIVQKNYCISIY